MGTLIVIEGLDSSGKETQSRLLEQRLRGMGKKVMRVEFPDYDSPSSALVKLYLQGELGKEADSVNAYAASSFYAVDRYASYKMKWEKFYEEGGIVIADRYTTSNIIHQAGKIRKEKEQQAFLEWLETYEYILLGLPRPQKVFFLHVPLSVSLALMRSRKNKIDGQEQKDIHERDICYLQNTYETAMKMAKQFGWDLIECTDGTSMFLPEKISDELLKRML